MNGAMSKPCSHRGIAFRYAEGYLTKKQKINRSFALGQYAGA
jgi:hypothetical protein